MVRITKYSRLLLLSIGMLFLAQSGKADICKPFDPSVQDGTEFIFRSTSGMLNSQTSLPSAAWDGIYVIEDSPYPSFSRRKLTMYDDSGETEEGGGNIDENVSDLSEVGRTVPIGDVPWGLILFLSSIVMVYQWRTAKHHHHT